MNRFTFRVMNYHVDPVLDGILNISMDNGIEQVTSEDGYHLTVHFKNGAKVRAWNVNRYYAWLSSGDFEYANEQKYNWKDARPRRSTMARLHWMLDNLK